MGALKILLVDDTKLLLEIGKSFLANSPVRVLTAQNGEEAMEVMKKERPDLVILDQCMPKMSGVECCAAMRSTPTLKGISVIMISGSASKEDQAAFAQVGCNAFLAKPLDRQLFLEKVRTFLPSIDRRELRVSCRMPLAMEIPGAVFTGVSEDLSLGGIYAATEHLIPAETRISLRFRLPGRADNPLIVAKGRVAWVNRAQKLINPRFSPGFGVEFLEITGEGLAILRKSEIQEFVQSAGKNGTRAAAANPR
jgi:CheY-like chemotaxis protein